MAKGDKNNRKGVKSRRNIEGNANWADVAIHLIDAFMESVNRGTAYIFFLFILLIGILFQTYKMTSEGVDAFWIEVLNKGSSGFWAVAIIVITNLGWWTVHRNRVKIMQKEVDRLCEIRRKLMHGEELTPLEQHIHSDSHKNSPTMLFPEVQTSNMQK